VGPSKGDLAVLKPVREVQLEYAFKVLDFAFKVLYPPFLSKHINGVY